MNLERAAGVNAQHLQRTHARRARIDAEEAARPGTSIDDRIKFAVPADRAERCTEEYRRTGDVMAYGVQLRDLFNETARATRDPVLRTALRARAIGADYCTPVTKQFDERAAARGPFTPAERDNANEMVRRLLRRLGNIGPAELTELPPAAAKEVLDHALTMRSAQGILAGMSRYHTALDQDMWNMLNMITRTTSESYGRQICKHFMDVVAKDGKAPFVELNSLDDRLLTNYMRSRGTFELDPTPENWARLSKIASEAQAGMILTGVQPAAVGHIAMILDPSTKTFASSLQRIRAKLRQTQELEAAARRLQDELLLDDTPAAAPAGKKSASKAKAKKSRAKSSAAQRVVTGGSDAAAADESATSRNLGNPLDTAIDTLLGSTHAPTRFEGETARFVRDNLNAFAEVVATNLKIRDTKQIRAELDVVLNNAIIECTMNTQGKEKQLQRQLSDRTVNPLELPVVLYAPNYRADAQARLPATVHFARTEQDLADTLFALRAGAMQAVRGGSLRHATN